jgi:hypothetical protein
MIKVGKYNIDIQKLQVEVDGEMKDIDTLPYSEKDKIEACYTANYISDMVDISEEDAYKLGVKAREIMSDYHISEEDAVEEVLRDED